MTLRALSGLLVCALLAWPLTGLAGTEPTEQPNPGLEVVEQTRNGQILAATDIHWDIYTRIRLDRATVEFRKNWARDQRQRSGITIREADEERIKTSMSDLFEEVFVKEMTNPGPFIMTGESGAGVLHFTPRIIDLDIYAPDRARSYIGGALTDSQGRMTIELEIRDSISGALLATTSHHERDDYKGYMEWTTSVTNRRAARLMLERWAAELREQFDELKAANPD